MKNNNTLWLSVQLEARASVTHFKHSLCKKIRLKRLMGPVRKLINQSLSRTY